MAGRQLIRLEVPGVLRIRPVVLEAVAAACDLVEGGRPRAGHDFRNHVVSAVSEAFNNIALHSYRDMTPGTVRIDMQLLEGGVVIELCDDGRSFDPAAVPEPKLEGLPESGLGIYIMRNFVDEVDYSPGRPNILTLKKWLGDGPKER